MTFYGAPVLNKTKEPSYFSFDSITKQASSLLGGTRILKSLRKHPGVVTLAVAFVLPWLKQKVIEIRSKHFISVYAKSKWIYE